MLESRKPRLDEGRRGFQVEYQRTPNRQLNAIIAVLTLVEALADRLAAAGEGPPQQMFFLQSNLDLENTADPNGIIGLRHRVTTLTVIGDTQLRHDAQAS